MAQCVSRKALRDGEEGGGGQRVERELFRSEQPRQGTGHSRDSGPGASEQSSPVATAVIRSDIKGEMAKNVRQNLKGHQH